MAASAQKIVDLRLRRMMVALSGGRLLRKKPPAQRYPAGAQLQYTKALRDIQRAIEARIREVIFPQLPGLVELGQINRGDGRVVTFDATTTDVITRLIGDVEIGIAEQIEPGNLNAVAGDAAGAVNNANSREQNRIFQSVLGIDPTTAEPWLPDAIDAFRKENVNLIKSLVGDELIQVENILIRGQRQGLRVEVIRKQIQERFGVSRKRAALIARDQTNKLMGELTGLRQTSLGVEEYIWRTSLDGRVRDSHIPLEGKTFKWSDPPVTNPKGDRNHPGGDYQCRCYAEPVIQPLVDAMQVGPDIAALRIPKIRLPKAQPIGALR